MSKEVIEQKKLVVSEIADKFKNSQSAIVVEYHGLNVAEMTELRRNLRDENVDIKVYKNKFAQRACEEAGMAELNEHLVGPNALVFGQEDAVAPARVLAKFAKDHEALNIKAGYVEGKFLPQEELMSVAKLPNRSGMYSMLLGCMQAPVSKFARVLQAVADSKEEAAPAAE